MVTKGHIGARSAVILRIEMVTVRHIARASDGVDIIGQIGRGPIEHNRISVGRKRIPVRIR